MTRIPPCLHPLVVLVTVLPALLAPSTADACGGMFCDSVAPILQPVEQNAERVLFEIGEDTVTAIVEISYTGIPSDFSWVVPVPDEPTLAVVPTSSLLLLDDATSPTLTSQRTSCRDRGYGCSMAAAPMLLMGCAASGYEDYDYDGGVDVVELPRVGPYLSEVITSDDAGELIDWLNNHGYLITEEMEPFVADYVAQGMRFLAMQLASDATTGDIAPISMTYPGTVPSIPLVLTSVSAEPDMGVMVFVAAQERYQSSNWVNMLVDPQDVRADPRTQETNYYPLVSYLADRVGGRAFVTEYGDSLGDAVDVAQSRWGSDPTNAEEQAWLTDLRGRQPQLTRMYTRISGWEMVSDPLFEPSPGGRVTNQLDLTDNEPVEICAEVEAVPCGSTYCGDGASCATTEFGEGCVCPSGTLARSIETPQLNGQPLAPSVVCQDRDFDLMGSVDAFDAGPSDPCEGFDCGSGGQCIALNGFPTCECADGGAAVVSFDGSLTCSQALEIHDPEDALLPDRTDSGAAVVASNPSPDPLGAAALMAMVLLPVAMLRRR